MQKLLTFCSVSLVVTFLCLSASAQPLSELGKQDRLNSIKERGLEHLQARAGSRGLRTGDEFETLRVFLDEEGLSHLHVQQTHLGVPVFGAEAIVHMNDAGDLVEMTDDLTSEVRTVNIIPSFDHTTAAELAVDMYGCRDCLTAEPQVDLWILHQAKAYRLAYRIRLDREDGTHQTAMPVIFIDAHSGKYLWSYDNLQTATGSGNSLYSGTVSIVTYLSGSTYYMEDIGRKVGTFDSRNTTSSTYRFTDTDNNWIGSSQRAGVDAHFGAEKVYDYYYNTHGRRGIDGAGGPAYYTAADGVTGLISSKVHYSSGYNNAFWNGSYMTYGDGDGTSFTPLVTLDICGHEMTHGVTERTAGLTYSNESGALNESMSDVFGTLVERYTESTWNWKIGEDAYTPGTAGDALRYMDNPHAARNAGYTADDDPDHYAERYTGTGDNGGVHINSGIANKAFYLLAVGGTHHRSGIAVTGIGADAAGKIWYRALTSYMTSSTNFAGARTATLNAAAALYGSGSTNYNAVARAWSACGVN